VWGGGLGREALRVQRKGGGSVRVYNMIEPGGWPAGQRGGGGGLCGGAQGRGHRDKGEKRGCAALLEKKSPAAEKNHTRSSSVLKGEPQQARHKRIKKPAALSEKKQITGG